MEKTHAPRPPTLLEAALSMASLIAGIIAAIVLFGQDPHISILLGVLVACIVGWRCGYGWNVLQAGLIAGIERSLQAIIILIVVGMLIGVWILAGVVPTLIYYGLGILSPAIFLPATLVICAITSLATGTSWGTSGTIGVALIGVGAGLGFPLPMVAGAVLSGAYFGDKMSPLSDTTNMAPAMAGTDVFTHIKHMSYTTSVSVGLSLLVFVVLGLQYSGGAEDVEKVELVRNTLATNFTINPVLLLPALIVLIASYRGVPAIPGITLGVIAGAVCAFGLQGSGYEAVTNAAYGGYEASTGVSEVDELLSRGGLSSMMFTISLVMVAMMFGGVMEQTNQLKVIADRLLAFASSTGSLVLTTVLTCIGANLILCDQYMAIVVGGRTFAGAYKDRGLHPKNLSRAVEDSATVTANLVPWNSGGAFQAATLGVATLAYLPFNIFCWISPIVTIIFGYMGWTMDKIDPAALREELGFDDGSEVNAKAETKA